MYYYQRLRDLREDYDKTQKDIADFLNITQVQYHRYEERKTRDALPYGYKAGEILQCIFGLYCRNDQWEGRADQILIKW